MGIPALGTNARVRHGRCIVSAPRWRGWLVAAAIFILGLAVGAAGAAWFGTRLVRQALQAPLEAPGLADRAAVRIGAELTKTLELTPDQSARIQGQLAQSAANLKAVRLRARAQAAAELRDSIKRISAELPPEKRAEFQRLVARRYEQLGLPATQADRE